MTTQEREDQMLRDLIFSSSTQFSDEEMKRIEQEAVWIKLTDDGVEFSQGMIDMLRKHEGKDQVKNTTVTCDFCNADLTYSKGVSDYRLLLTSESIPLDNCSITMDVLSYPPLARSHHFCGLGCLGKWVHGEKVK